MREIKIQIEDKGDGKGLRAKVIEDGVRIDIERDFGKWRVTAMFLNDDGSVSNINRLGEEIDIHVAVMLALTALDLSQE